LERGRDLLACETLARSPFQDRRVVDDMMFSCIGLGDATLDFKQLACPG
jgi:hypothetical protein